MSSIKVQIKTGHVAFKSCYNFLKGSLKSSFLEYMKYKENLISEISANSLAQKCRGIMQAVRTMGSEEVINSAFGNFF